MIKVFCLPALILILVLILMSFLLIHILDHIFILCAHLLFAFLSLMGYKEELYTASMQNWKMPENIFVWYSNNAILVILF